MRLLWLPAKAREHRPGGAQCDMTFTDPSDKRLTRRLKLASDRGIFSRVWAMRVPSTHSASRTAMVDFRRGSRASFMKKMWGVQKRRSGETRSKSSRCTPCSNARPRRAADSAQNVAATTTGTGRSEVTPQFWKSSHTRTRGSSDTGDATLHKRARPLSQ